MSQPISVQDIHYHVKFLKSFTQIIRLAFEIFVPLHSPSADGLWTSGQQEFSFRPKKICALPRQKKRCVDWHSCTPRCHFSLISKFFDILHTIHKDKKKNELKSSARSFRIMYDSIVRIRPSEAAQATSRSRSPDGEAGSCSSDTCGLQTCTGRTG